MMRRTTLGWYDYKQPNYPGYVGYKPMVSPEFLRAAIIGSALGGAMWTLIILVIVWAV